MDAVEILLLCVVGFSVLVFLVVDSLDWIRKTCPEADPRSGIYNPGRKTAVGWYFVEAAKCDSENPEVDISKQIREEEADNQVNACSEESDTCNGQNAGEGAGESLDDWEGIESTELEKIFGEAVVFVSHKSNAADKIDGDAKLQLYGLQKIALEGPCHGSQPTALKVSARTKWTAWQKLGNMSPDEAMEEYVHTLAEVNPGWKGEGTEAIRDGRSSVDSFT